MTAELYGSILEKLARQGYEIGRLVRTLQRAEEPAAAGAR